MTSQPIRERFAYSLLSFDTTLAGAMDTLAWIAARSGQLDSALYVFHLTMIAGGFNCQLRLSDALADEFEAELSKHMREPTCSF